MPKVQMPQLGESVAEGTIGKWLKKPGDHVDKYEPIVEVITDKVNAEVPSPYEGTLTEILVQEGETVPNNTDIAVIDAVGEAAEATEQAPPAEAAAASAGTRSPPPRQPPTKRRRRPAGTARQDPTNNPSAASSSRQLSPPPLSRPQPRPPPRWPHRRPSQQPTARPVRTATRARPPRPCAGWRASTESTWRWSPAPVMAAE